MKLRPYQEEKSNEILEKLKKLGCVYLRGEVRSGKTITSLEVAKKIGAIKVLFLTKKGAIPSILNDYKKMGYTYALVVINYESAHKLADFDFNLVIYDESHVLGGFPKPSNKTKFLKSKLYNVDCIWQTGTPAAESYSQFFHQFFVNKNSPFIDYVNFYKWSKDFVNVTRKKIGTHEINDYSDADVNKIEAIIDSYSVKMSQKETGIKQSVKEIIIELPMPSNLKKISDKLKKDRAIKGKSGYIMGEMPAKLMSKIHQIQSGTVIIDDFEGVRKQITLSKQKALYIKDNFKDSKICIMYYYKQELEVLKDVFRYDITTDISEFNLTKKNIAIQQSSTEGMNVSKADCIVFYNFGFSGKNYIQSRDRLTVRGRIDNKVYFIIEKGGINEKILKRIINKKNYTLKQFMNETTS